MKRFLTAALILGVSSTFGLVGCSDESKVKETTEVSTPEGSETKTTETKVESTGTPPAATPGPAATPEPAPTPEPAK